MGKQPEDVIEFPDSTVNVKLAFSEKDIKLLDDESTETTDTSRVSESSGSNIKFAASLAVLSSAGITIIVLHSLASLSTTLSGIASLIIAIIAYEWQRMYACSLSRIPRASLNYSDLIDKNKDYIPFYTMGWLLGERYKPYVMGCTPEEPDDRTPNEPEAISPDRELPKDPKFLR
ncbi:unnamed protein product [Strongylus vulgaris]|uniref:Uncharacterized protein n=1 Tax=Strongylus vulgaris TaxID=40348 RepID=A0A3P7I6Z9_STRVU|nr:unnamed protein product [Strongylus vulgaris]